MKPTIEEQINNQFSGALGVVAKEMPGDNYDVKVAKKLLYLQNSARNRGIEFNVSFAKLKKVLQTKKCFYSGVTLTDQSVDKGPEYPNKLTIDRVDADQGYIDSNIVACSHQFNQLKKDFNMIQIEQLFKGIEKFKSMNKKKSLKVVKLPSMQDAVQNHLRKIGQI